MKCKLRIELENIGQIEHADIVLDGITVIAGENNTGKSTVGRALFAMLRDMNSWRDEYLLQCSARIRKKLEEESSQLEEFCLANTSAFRRRTNRANELMGSLCNNPNFLTEIEDYQVEATDHGGQENVAAMRVRDALEHFCIDYIGLYQKDDPETFFKKNSEFFARWIEHLMVDLRDNIQLDELVLQAKQIREAFSYYFKDQYITEGKEQCKIILYEGEKENVLQMTKLDTMLSAPIRVNYGIYFLESPKIFDEIGKMCMIASMSAREDMRALMIPNVFGRIRLLNSRKIPSGRYLSEEQENVEDIPLEAAEVLEMLREEMNGQAEYYAKEGVKFKEEGTKASFYSQNVSTGLKAMAVLEYAVRTGAIQKNDVLILDEPEINLHPQWQIVYARALVLLQKAYQLKLLITTHSPYFLRAIECFSDLYSVMDSLNVYFVSKDSEKKHVIEDVMQSEFGMTELYDRLSSPFDQLQEEIDRKYGKDEGE